MFIYLLFAWATNSEAKYILSVVPVSSHHSKSNMTALDVLPEATHFFTGYWQKDGTYTAPP